MATKITWNETSIRRLKEFCERTVDCNGDQIPATLDHVAMWMDSTRSAIATAMTRHGLIFGKFEIDEHGHVCEVTLKKCMSCTEVFGSRGKHNRLCDGCGGVGSGRRQNYSARQREAA